MKFYALSLGCKVNEYEIDAVEEQFLNKGYILDKDNPDVFIINTCSVTSVADQKSRQHIRKIRKNYPNLKCLVVMGCYSQHAGKFISEELGADIVIGTSKRNILPTLVDTYIKTTKKILMIDEDFRHFKYESFGVIPNINKTRAYIKIQDGCDNFCSYCIIPFTRGNSRSRDKEEIIAEIKSLVNKGYKEVVLTGIHTAGYGKDLDNFTFSDLVEKILNEVPDLYRLRISSIEESEIDDKFISLLKKDNRIANHLHIPTQSGCSKTLKNMHRKYNVDDFYKKIELIRNARPDIAITTDVIVGFPGETEEDFMETLNFIKKIKFAELHVFPFSAREKTIAMKMPNQIEPSIKKDRVTRLIKLGNELNLEYKKQFIGKDLEVLFEDYNKDTKTWKGHTSNYLEVSYQSDDNLHGKVLKLNYKI